MTTSFDEGDGVRTLAKRFLPEWLERCAEVRLVLDDPDPARIERARVAAHQLAGGLGSFGFPDAGAAARAVEDELVPECDPARLAPLVERLAVALDEVVTALGPR